MNNLESESTHAHGEKMLTKSSKVMCWEQSESYPMFVRTICSGLLGENGNGTKTAIKMLFIVVIDYKKVVIVLLTGAISSEYIFARAGAQKEKQNQ